MSDIIPFYQKYVGIASHHFRDEREAHLVAHFVMRGNVETYYPVLRQSENAVYYSASEMFSQVHAEGRGGHWICLFVSADMYPRIICIARYGEEFGCAAAAYIEPDLVFFGHIYLVYFTVFDKRVYLLSERVYRDIVVWHFPSVLTRFAPYYR